MIFHTNPCCRNRQSRMFSDRPLILLIDSTVRRDHALKQILLHHIRRSNRTRQNGQTVSRKSHILISIMAQSSSSSMQKLAQNLPRHKPQHNPDDVWGICGYGFTAGYPGCRNKVRRQIAIEQGGVFCYRHAKPETRMKYFFSTLPLEIIHAILELLDPFSRVALALCNKDSAVVVKQGGPYRRREKGSDRFAGLDFDFALRFEDLDMPGRLQMWYEGPDIIDRRGEFTQQLANWFTEHIGPEFDHSSVNGSVIELLFFTMRCVPWLFGLASRDAWSCLYCPRTITDRQLRYKTFAMVPTPKSAFVTRYSNRFHLGLDEVYNAHRFVRDILCCDSWPACQEEDHDNTFWKHVRQGARPTHGLEIARLYWATQNL